MVELKRLEELRTKREVEEYFKQLGKEITEEELNVLKQSYDKAQKSSGALTMQQLDDVAGGTLHCFIIPAHETMMMIDDFYFSINSIGKDLCSCGRFHKITTQGIFVDHIMAFKNVEDGKKNILVCDLSNELAPIHLGDKQVTYEDLQKIIYEKNVKAFPLDFTKEIPEDHKNLIEEIATNVSCHFNYCFGKEDPFVRSDPDIAEKSHKLDSEFHKLLVEYDITPENPDILKFLTKTFGGPEEVQLTLAAKRMRIDTASDHTI